MFICAFLFQLLYRLLLIWVLNLLLRFSEHARCCLCSFLRLISHVFRPELRDFALLLVLLLGRSVIQGWRIVFSTLAAGVIIDLLFCAWWTRFWAWFIRLRNHLSLGLLCITAISTALLVRFFIVRGYFPALHLLVLIFLIEILHGLIDIRSLLIKHLLLFLCSPVHLTSTFLLLLLTQINNLLLLSSLLSLNCFIRFVSSLLLHLLLILLLLLDFSRHNYLIIT